MIPLPGMPEAIALAISAVWFAQVRHSARVAPARTDGHRKDPVPNPNPSPDPLPENDPEADPDRQPLHEPEPEPEPITAFSPHRGSGR